MGTTTLVPVEQYLRLADKPSAEYRDGVLYPKPMPTKLHSVLQRLILRALAAYEDSGVQAYPELTVRVSSLAYLIPDIVISRDFEGPYPTEPVLLCCEILYPQDRLGLTFSKCEEYHEWGVPYCWVLDPVKRTAWEYHKGGEPNRVQEILQAGEIRINLSELFAQLPAQA